jgi:16S rRNA (uracil1498-N3)-methyltransferase
MSMMADNFCSKSVGKTVVVENKELAHRLANIVRVQHNDRLILFDRNYHVVGILEKYEGKKTIKIAVIAYVKNKKLSPHIVFLLPLLKREACERALYSLVELGAQEIQLILTEKVQRKWQGQKDLDRINRIVIAAAEQSKNFAFPKVKEPLWLADILLLPCQGSQIFFDANGDQLRVGIDNLIKKKATHITLMIGPEGDLTDHEKMLLRDHGFSFYMLTSTVLRSFQAAAVSLGAVRSLL